MSLLSDENIINLDFKKGIELLNLQEKSKIERIFSRVLEHETRIRIEPQLKNEGVFSDTELQQLCPILNKVETTEQLEKILHALTTIICDSVYQVAKPNVLHSRLIQLNLREDLCVSLATAWSTRAQSLISAERKHSVMISSTTRLQSVDYSINATVEEPTSVFKFSLSSDQQDNQEKFHLQMNSEELFKFYQQLEMIQVKLDSLK